MELIPLPGFSIRANTYPLPSVSLKMVGFEKNGVLFGLTHGENKPGTLILYYSRGVR